MGKRKMSLAEACEMVPDDLPDGAYWQMAHDIAGAEHGEAWDELQEERHYCPICRKGFSKEESMFAHHRDAHQPNERVKCKDPRCNKQFKKELDMLQHHEFVHNKKEKS
jgi:hypothetical protein